MTFKLVPATIFFAIVCQIMFSGNDALAQRPKVGLVLSGGGAKGISHIGILQAVDSAGLKIDYLIRTGMGSIIGTFYAIGCFVYGIHRNVFS